MRRPDPADAENIRKNTIPAENPLAVFKLSRKAFWEGRIMPSILRGSKKHNEAVRAADAERAKQAKQALAVVTTTEPSVSESSATGPAAQPPAETSEVKPLPSASLGNLRETLVAHAQNILNEQHSPLYCNETLALSPQKSAAPKAKLPPLSPFSQAKQTAKRCGVGLSDECRGVYPIDEINSRIEFLASVTKKQRR